MILLAKCKEYNQQTSRHVIYKADPSAIGKIKNKQVMQLDSTTITRQPVKKASDALSPDRYPHSL